MKLNYKRTVLVGMAFLSICAFWQLYDNVVPLILKNTFHVPDDIAGVIMALDNILALFLLPLFGKLSDGCRTRLGKRMPFILGGTLAAVILMNLLPAADKAQNLALFIVALGLLLIAMGTYRSPAVALMPDVTPKPLRSKGNAIINLMGALGGVFTLGVTGFLVSKNAAGREDYTLLFLAVSLLMAVSVIVLLITIRENKLAQEAEAVNAEEIEPAEEAEPAPSASAGGFGALPRELRRSLILILCSVSLWFMGYNAGYHGFHQIHERTMGLRYQGRLAMPDDRHGGSRGKLPAGGSAFLPLWPQARDSSGRAAAFAVLCRSGVLPNLPSHRIRGFCADRRGVGHD